MASNKEIIENGRKNAKQYLIEAQEKLNLAKDALKNDPNVFWYLVFLDVKEMTEEIKAINILSDNTN